MIEKFVNLFLSQKEDVLYDLKQEVPRGYNGLLVKLFYILNEEIEKIVRVDEPDYQGQHMFIVCCKFGSYYSCRVSYGSCSSCDTFQRCREDNDIVGFWTIMLHMVQNLKEL